MKNELTLTRLKELLNYNPLTGVFTWKVDRPRNIKANSIAGHKIKHGYLSISIDSCNYLAHRLAWLFVYEKFPDMHIDHINGITSDNSIINLRDVSASHNQQNRKKCTKANRCGLIGASWHVRQSQWIAQIKKDGHNYHLGTFETKEEAHEAYLKAKRQMHPTCTI